ncbi:phosphatidylinositol mannoside acyltransferase [Geodermatophilus sabuli]|uniref:KDO2-lipid IV(A) lauroyltransferase n=1 Tax=Geodermatophilus sabuli TaxID=1564158 RepID=A0A285E7Q9_9ACTN|nr:phosphatidylinositol mannoside acyltransferase [Geodermatophilus sabuli]MBB3081969.1 KDO2-lipid IV(A) lauroyltransferase [Geodermatophilus sabuli]SNX95159.1 KDO2-lipid IV(A) lauroyltransferase [Geodermatophilus sabuli]
MTDASPAGTGAATPPALSVVPARPGLRARAGARVTDLGFAAGWGAVKLLPEPVARGAFDAAGRWAAGRQGRGVRQLRANLRVATDGRLTDAELDALTTRAVRSYARYWQEAFRLPRLSTERVVARTEVIGREHLDRARSRGAGLVMVLPHSGNWDAAGVWFTDYLDGPFMTVAERLRPESLYRRFVDYRESLGMRVVPLTGGPRPSTEVLREWLSDGGVTCLLVDRNLGAGGVPVSLFGRQATFPGGAALLAERTGAPLVPTVCQFTPRGWRLVFSPEVPVAGPGRLRDRVAAAMQGVADAFAEGIASQPEDWHVPGRIWPDVPPDGVPVPDGVPAGPDGAPAGGPGGTGRELR